MAGIRLRAGALGITGLTVRFLVIIGSALVRGLNIECGCFGTIGGQHVGLVHLAIDLTHLSLAPLLTCRTPEGSENGVTAEAGAPNTVASLDG